MPNTTLVNKSVLLLVVAIISALFFGIIGRFLEAIFLAGLFSAVCHPLYRWFLKSTGNRQALSSLATMILVLFFIIIPVALIATIVVGQATDFATKALPWVQNLANDPGIVTQQLEKLPFYNRLLPYRDILTERIGGVLVSISGTGVSLLQSVTLGTFNALLTGLLVLYSFFFFLMDGSKLVHRILYYLPLDDKNEHLLLNRFRSVTIATLKGTAVIGFLQGGLAGMALGFCGVPNATFWSVAMMMLSVVPGIGAALVWIPACIYLAATGKVAVAVGLFAFCGLLVGSIDNVLRPKLVGSDTQLHELMIFFSTLGGILTFGMSGFIIGPIIAALFVTVWEIYGVEFRHWLPSTAFVPYDHNNSAETSVAEAEPLPDDIVELTEQRSNINEPLTKDGSDTKDS